MKNKNYVVNLGCRLNIYEGEIIKNHLKTNNLNNVTVINSCAVTEEAEKKVSYEIRKAKKNFPNNKIVVTGCAAQINPLKYKDYINAKDIPKGAPIEVLDTLCVGDENITGNESSEECIAKGGKIIKVKEPSLYSLNIPFEAPY